MLGQTRKIQKIIQEQIRQKGVKTIMDSKSFSIHTQKPVAHKTLGEIAEKTNTWWVGFDNQPDYLFTSKETV